MDLGKAAQTIAVDVGKAAQTIAGWPPAVQAAAIAGIATVLAALIGGRYLLLNERWKRQHEARLQAQRFVREDWAARRQRLGPGLRSLLEVGEALEGVTVRLTEWPPDEVRAAGDELTRRRQQLNELREPELHELRERFHRMLNDVVQRRARVQGIQNQPISDKLFERVIQDEDEHRYRIRELIEEVRQRLVELEQPVA